MSGEAIKERAKSGKGYLTLALSIQQRVPSGGALRLPTRERDVIPSFELVMDDDEEEKGDPFAIPDLWKTSTLTCYGHEGERPFVTGLEAIGRDSP